MTAWDKRVVPLAQNNAEEKKQWPAFTVQPYRVNLLQVKAARAAQTKLRLALG